MGVTRAEGKEPMEEGGGTVGCWSRSTLRRAFPTGFKAETRVVMKILPPLVISTMAQWYVQPIALIFAGHLGKIELDAVGMACSLINVLGYSIAFGMTAACDASFAQTFGGNNKKMMGVYLQKCLFIISLSALPCYAIHLNIEGILQLLGQDRQVARLCGQYLLIHTPGTFSLFLYLILQKYFQCQSIVYPDIWMGLLSHAIHAALQYVLLYNLNMGVVGSAIASASYYVSSLLFRVIYFFCSKKVKVTWGGWSLQCFVGWGPLTRLAVYGSMLMCAEWWAYEAGTVLAGLFGTAVLGAQTIIFNMTTIAAALAAGISMAATISMGQYLGAGMPQHAKTSGRVTTIIIILSGAMVMIVWLVFPNDLGKIFTNEKDVLVIISSMIPILAVYVFMNSITVLARCIFRAVAKQKEAAFIVFVCYYLVALPIGYSLMFLTSWKIWGMWLGFLVCTILLATIMTARYMWSFDWEAIAKEAQIRACVREEYERTLPTDLRTALLSGSARSALLSGSTRSGNTRSANTRKGSYGALSARTGSYGAISTRKGSYGLLPDHQPSFEKSFYAMTGSTDVPPGIIKLQEVPVDRCDVIKKLVVIFVFVGIAMIGLVVRLATADLVDQCRREGIIRYAESDTVTSSDVWDVTSSGAWNMTLRRSSNMTSLAI